MEEIKRQVIRARRRMIAQQFLRIVTWSLFATLLLAALGLGVPKLWVLQVDSNTWFWSWLGGGLGAGLLLALVWTWLVRHGAMAAALEIDRRFGLKERVSSSLALTPNELESDIGQALVDDAVGCVQRIDVRENFPVSMPWRAMLPLVPAAAIFLLAVLVPDAAPEPAGNAVASSGTESQQVKNSAEALKKRLERLEKKAEQKGLKDMDVLFKELQKGLDELTSKQEVDRKNAMVKLNDVAKNLEQRRDLLGGADKIRQQLDKLKDLDGGPADKMAQALKDGDLEGALKELKKLQEALKEGQLTDDQKQQLAKQAEQFKNKLQDAVDAHEQAKRGLEEEIKKRLAAGDLEGAGKAQQQLDQLNKLNDQMSRLQQMADKFGQCQQCLQHGDAKDAAAQLQQLAQDLKNLQGDLQELQTLDDVLEQIADAKQCMNCKHCNGQGCEACMGMNGGQQEGPPGRGLGEGQGQGDRPQQKTDTSFYETQVRGKVQPGEAVRTGSAGGANRAGRSLEEVKDQIRSSLDQEPEPLTDVRLPRNEREQVKEYYQRLNKR
jgi:hypothetical protein